MNSNPMTSPAGYEVVIGRGAPAGASPSVTMLASVGLARMTFRVSISRAVCDRCRSWTLTTWRPVVGSAISNTYWPGLSTAPGSATGEENFKYVVLVNGPADADEVMRNPTHTTPNTAITIARNAFFIIPTSCSDNGIRASHRTFPK